MLVSPSRTKDTTRDDDGLLLLLLLLPLLLLLFPPILAPKYQSPNMHGSEPEVRTPQAYVSLPCTAPKILACTIMGTSNKRTETKVACSGAPAELSK